MNDLNKQTNPKPQAVKLAWFEALLMGASIITLGFCYFTLLQSFPFVMLLVTVVLLLMLLVWLIINSDSHESNHKSMALYGSLFLIGFTLAISNQNWAERLAQTIQENPLNF